MFGIYKTCVKYIKVDVNIYYFVPNKLNIFLMYHTFLKCVRTGAWFMNTDWHKYFKTCYQYPPCSTDTNIGLASSVIYLEQVLCILRKYFCSLWRVTPEMLFFWRREVHSTVFIYTLGERSIFRRNLARARTQTSRSGVQPYVGSVGRKKRTPATKAVRVWNSL